MATSAVRRIVPKEVRRFGNFPELFESPDLTQIQTLSYERFLENQLRHAFGFEGTPLVIKVRTRPH